jgi:hypothetical protein
VGVAPALATTDVTITHCGSGSQTVQANQELVITGGWIAGSLGHVDKFLKAQRVQWTLTTSAGTVSGGGATFGDTTNWSAPFSFIGVGGKTFWRTNYSDATGVVLASGETATFNFTITTDKKVYDDVSVYPPGTIFSVSNCIITAV